MARSPERDPVAAAPAVPPRASWTDAGLGFAGGMVGTTVRAVLIAVTPFPTTVLLINLSGAFVLGWLLRTLALEAQSHRTHRARVAVGTGVLGGYTTYSTFAVGDDGLIRVDDVGLAVIYAIATIVLGVLAAAAGRRLAERGAGRRA